MRCALASWRFNTPGIGRIMDRYARTGGALESDLKKLSIVIPVYNEARWIEELLRRVAAADCAGLSREVVVVDDCSSDGTSAILEGLAPKYPFLQVFRQPANRGKGAALR